MLALTAGGVKTQTKVVPRSFRPWMKAFFICMIGGNKDDTKERTILFNNGHCVYIR